MVFPGALPIVAQLVAMKLSPLDDQLLGPARQAADYEVERLDIEGGLLTGVLGVEMRASRVGASS
jgi:hypothetical protein